MMVMWCCDCGVVCVGRVCGDCELRFGRVKSDDGCDDV